MARAPTESKSRIYTSRIGGSVALVSAAAAPRMNWHSVSDAGLADVALTHTRARVYAMYTPQDHKLPRPRGGHAVCCPTGGRSRNGGDDP